MAHLGDVYYAGTNAGLLERDYEQANFLAPWPWPATQGKSLALNSNHDMYAHGTGYFNTALASPLSQPPSAGSRQRERSSDADEPTSIARSVAAQCCPRLQ